MGDRRVPGFFIFMAVAAVLIFGAAALGITGKDDPDDRRGTSAASPSSQASRPARDDARGFKAWVRESYPGSSAETLIRRAYVGGVVNRRIVAVVPAGTTTAKAKTICMFLNFWVLDVGADRNVPGGEVRGDGEDWIARCKPNSPTETNAS